MNVIVNWILIFGKFGVPALGVRGAAWATVVSRVVMAGFLLVVIVQREWGRAAGTLRDPARHRVDADAAAARRSALPAACS